MPTSPLRLLTFSAKAAGAKTSLQEEDLRPQAPRKSRARSLLPPRLSAPSGGSRAGSTPGHIWDSREQEARPAAACQLRPRAFGSSRHAEQHVQPRSPPTPSRQAQRCVRRMVLSGSHAAWALLVTDDARKPQCVRRTNTGEVIKRSARQFAFQLWLVSSLQAPSNAISKQFSSPSGHQSLLVPN